MREQNQSEGERERDHGSSRLRGDVSPSMSLTDLLIACEMASSVAPPPGNMRGSNTTLRTTCIAS